MKDNKIQQIKSKIRRTQGQINAAQSTLEELSDLLDQFTIANIPAQSEIKIGGYVISKNRPNNNKAGKVTSASKSFLTVTPDNPNEKPFKKARHNLALLQ